MLSRIINKNVEFSYVYTYKRVTQTIKPNVKQQNNHPNYTRLYTSSKRMNRKIKSFRLICSIRQKTNKSLSFVGQCNKNEIEI